MSNFKFVIHIHNTINRYVFKDTVMGIFEVLPAMRILFFLVLVHLFDD